LEEAGAVVVEHKEQSTPNKQVCCTVAEKDTYIKGNEFFQVIPFYPSNYYGAILALTKKKFWSGTAKGKIL